jgi:hypothetical protein
MNQQDIVNLIEREVKAMTRARGHNNFRIIHNLAKCWISIKIDVVGRRVPYAFYVYNDSHTRFHLAVNTLPNDKPNPNHLDEAEVVHHPVPSNTHERWDICFDNKTKIDDLGPLISAVLTGVRPYYP